MTRNEEIQNYAYNNCINDDIDDTSYSLIVEAAKWADATMIAKACEWLETELYTAHDNCGYKVTASFNSVDKKKFIENFKKAMELCI